MAGRLIANAPASSCTGIGRTLSNSTTLHRVIVMVRGGAVVSLGGNQTAGAPAQADDRSSSKMERMKTEH